MKSITCGIVIFVITVTLSGDEPKPLTNADVVKMVRAELPEGTIILAINANRRDFDSSVNALLELRSQGVSAAIIDAMLQPSPSHSATASVPQIGEATPNERVEKRRGTARPECFIVAAGDRSQVLEPEPFKIIETKAKGNSMASLVTESAVTEIAGGVVMQGAVNVLLASGGQFAGTVGAVAHSLTGLVGKKLFRSDEIAFTYICAIGGKASYLEISEEIVRFELSFDGVPGADADEFTPVLIRVTPTPKNWRLVGAIKARRSEFGQGEAREFNIIEERVAGETRKIARGRVEFSPTSQLAPGEYAMVLRPIDARKKVEFHEFEQEQGEGLILRQVWSFSVQSVSSEAPTASTGG